VNLLDLGTYDRVSPISPGEACERGVRSCSFQDSNDAAQWGNLFPNQTGSRVMKDDALSVGARRNFAMKMSFYPCIWLGKFAERSRVYIAQVA